MLRGSGMTRSPWIEARWGRLAVPAVVATAQLPAEIRNDLALYSICAAGAAEVSAVERMLAEAGFVRIRIVPNQESREMIREWAPGRRR